MVIMSNIPNYDYFEDLDKSCIRSLEENGSVWYKKNNRICYMSREWLDKVSNLQKNDSNLKQSS